MARRSRLGGPSLVDGIDERNPGLRRAAALQPLVKLTDLLVRQPELRADLALVKVPRRPLLPRPNRQWVLRSADFLSLHVELINLRPQARQDAALAPAVLTPSGAGPSYLVLHFGPQAVAEQVFFEQRPNTEDAHRAPPAAPPESAEQSAARKSADLPAGTEIPSAPPIRSRLSQGSRIVFRHEPARLKAAGIEAIEYTVAGILQACRVLPLNVASNARRNARYTLPKRGRLVSKATSKAFARLTGRSKAAVLANALVNQQIAGSLGASSLGLLLRRAEISPAPTAAPAPVRALAETVVPARAAITAAAVAPFSATRLNAAGSLSSITAINLARVVASPVAAFLRPPAPKQPEANQTALELPFRLILSPNEDGRFRHELAPSHNPASGHTALWRTELAADPGTASAPLRAIWARIGPDSRPHYFNADWQVGDGPKDQPEPATYNKPFRMTLDDRDRFNIVHQSSNFRLGGGAGHEAVDARQLMLSALGGWLDARGNWEPPPGLSVEEWVHQATQGRDHYVRVVYKGFLYPFGHQVSLVKVSERRFHHDRPGNPAYVRQRMFLVCKQPVREYEQDPVSMPPVSIGGIGAGIHLPRRFPFVRVDLLTRTTPDIQPPENSDLQHNGAAQGPRLFWPVVASGSRYAFHYRALGLNGQWLDFELPSIFIGNDLFTGQPADDQGPFASARSGWDADPETSRTAQCRNQKVRFAHSDLADPPQKAGDTDAEVISIEFEGHTADLPYRKPPYTYPQVRKAAVRVPALAGLGGASGGSTIRFHAGYLKLAQGFGAGGVFADIVSGPSLDFSAQGNRSGGLVQPNLLPSALSYITGPVAGDASSFAEGRFDPLSFFADGGPLLLGCIPLGELIKGLLPADFGSNLPKLPRFVADAATEGASLLARLGELGDLDSVLRQAAEQAVEAAIRQVTELAFREAKAQLALLDAETAQLQSAVEQVISKAKAAAQTIAAGIAALDNAALPLPADLGLLGGLLGNLRSALDSRLASLGNPVAAGFPGAGQALSTTVQAVARQQLEAVRLSVGRAEALLAAISTLPALFEQAKATADKAAAIIDGIQKALAKDNPAAPKIDDVAPLLAQLGALLPMLEDRLRPMNLLPDGLRQTALTLIGVVGKIVDAADTLLPILESLLGDELVLRFDWHPEIGPWPSAAVPLFNPHDPRGFVVGVEARMKKSGGDPAVNAYCSLSNFDLCLFGGEAAFIEIAFEKIGLKVSGDGKMDVDVRMGGIHFVGVLSFVETLRDLIPLDGFSDPPALSITEKGVDASFSMALPNLTIGVMSLTNLSLGAGFTVPFIGQPVAVRFNFCTRDQPFNLTVSFLGGGGFFGIVIDPHGVQLLEASFEFGACLAVDFAVASGSVHVMAGIYFRIGKTEGASDESAQLTGYLRMGGEVDVLGLISASIELYLALNYFPDSGKCEGEATITVEISLFIFSASVGIHAKRTFAGSNGDPSFAALLGPDDGVVLDDDSRYAWRTYCEAFA